MTLRLRWNMYKARLLRKYWRWMNTHHPTTCGYVCTYVYPYGFVPEAGCPIHDAHP